MYFRFCQIKSPLFSGSDILMQNLDILCALQIIPTHPPPDLLHHFVCTANHSYPPPPNQTFSWTHFVCTPHLATSNHLPRTGTSDRELRYFVWTSDLATSNNPQKTNKITAHLLFCCIPESWSIGPSKKNILEYLSSDYP